MAEVVQCGLKRCVSLVATCVIFSIGFVANEAWHRRSEGGRSGNRYLSSPSGDARRAAKESARSSVRKHGRRSTVEQKQAAENVMAAHRPKMTNRVATLDEMFARAKEQNRLERIRKGEFATAADEKEFTPEEREVLEVADEVISDHDLETAIDVAGEALKSNDPRVRQRAVETLTDFGEAGLPELADFLGDSDPEVARLAADRFELAVQEIENETEMVDVAKLGMMSVNDEEQLASMVGTLLLCNDALTVVSALAEVIEGGTPKQAAAAKEAYQSQTGEEWQGLDAADKWLQENYEPPDAED